jgi:hypothetical protein
VLSVHGDDDIDQIVNRLREEMSRFSSWSPEIIPPLAEALRADATARVIVDGVEE